MLNVLSGMNWPWFGPIANASESRPSYPPCPRSPITTPPVTQDFDLSVEQVNWLGNVINVIYLPVSLVVPVVVARWGIQKTVCSILRVYIHAWLTRGTVLRGCGYPPRGIMGTVCGHDPWPQRLPVIPSPAHRPSTLLMCFSRICLSYIATDLGWTGTAHFPSAGPKVLRDLVRPQGTHDRDHGHRNRYTLSSLSSLPCSLSRRKRTLSVVPSASSSRPSWALPGLRCAI
jgi:hypothetical protein